MADRDELERDRHRLIESLMASAPFGLAIIDRDFRYVYVNGALSAVHGVSDGSQIGRPVAEVMPALWPALEPLFRRVLAGETIVDHEVAEMAVVTGGGRHWRSSYYPVRLDGEIRGVGALVIDVTERWRTLVNLQERVKELGLLHATARMLHGGRPFDRELLGEVAALVPRAWQWPECCAARIRFGEIEVTTPGFRASPWRQSAAFGSGAAVGSIDVVYLEERPMEAEGPFLAEERTVLESLAEMLTVYEGRQRASDEHARVEGQLRQSQKMQALGTLAGGIAHDFNNILAAILGNAELASMQVDPGSRVGAHVSEIMRAADRAADLVRRILVFSRNAEAKRRLMDLRLPVEEAVALLRVSLPAAIRIDVDLPTGLPPVLADATQVHQVVMNLGTNAGHAMPAGGVLSVTLGHVRNREGTDQGPGALGAGSYVRLTVRDSGEGMTTEVLERAFEPFFTTKGPEAGTGLGLSVVHGIVRAHDGTIEIESSPDRGTTVSVWFPTAQGQVDPAAAAASLDVRGTGQHVIYVDDEAAVVEVMVQRIQMLGYRVTGYTSPALALESLTANPAEAKAVIVDSDMPGMSGRELATALKRVRADLPIAVTSGLGERKDGAFSRDLFALTIPKPSSKLELARALKSLLEGG